MGTGRGAAGLPRQIQFPAGRASGSCGQIHRGDGKKLSRIFGEAEKSMAILFFDEADVLFAKRTEIKESHDKYSNMEIAFLLQKMEEYEGISILATNYLQNFDSAFRRSRTKNAVMISAEPGLCSRKPKTTRLL